MKLTPSKSTAPFLTRTRWPAAATNLWVLCGGPPQPASPRPWQPGCTWHHWHSCCPWQPHHPGPWHHSQWLKWRRGFIFLSGGAIPKIVVKPSHVFTWPPMQDHNFKHNHLLVWRPFVLAIKCFSLIQHVVHVTFYQGNWEMAVLCKFKMEIMYKVWWGTFTLFFGQQIPEQIQGLWFFWWLHLLGAHCIALPCQEASPQRTTTTWGQRQSHSHSPKHGRGPAAAQMTLGGT